MTTENEREKAQLERAEGGSVDGVPTLFVGVLVSEYPGGAMQIRGIRKASKDEVATWKW